MKFSILIAHYNNWHYFQECYQSILNQTYHDYEIIIVDDCSNDGSYEKLVELSKKNGKIILFRNSENRKVGFTKNRCIEESSGEICGFLDPDDLISVNALEESVKAYKNNNVVATYSKIELIDEEGNIIGKFDYTRNVKRNNSLFFNINFEVAHFFTFRSDTYRKTDGINKKLIISEDQDLYMKLYEKGDFLFIDEYLYYYRKHDKGISQNKGKTEQQKKDWHIVLYNTCKRRNIDTLYGINVDTIENLPKFIFEKENTFFKKIKRKFL